MHLILSYSDGRLAEAIVLAVSADRMRVCIPGSDDTIELSAAHGRWMSETGELVEIESMVADSDLEELFAEVRPLAKAAARH